MATQTHQPSYGEEAPDPPVEEVQPKVSALTAALRETGDLVIFSARSLGLMAVAWRYLSEALRQLAKMISGTWFMLIVMGGFFGFAGVNGGYFVLRALGAQTYTSIILGYGGPHFVWETMFGFVFTAKVAAGMTSELGAMKIGEEIDAYETIGVDPYVYLVSTRLLATVVFSALGVALVMLGWIVGYFVVVDLYHGVPGNLLLHLNYEFMNAPAFLFAAVTTVEVGVATALVACFYGFRVRGGPEEIGRAAARAVTINLVVVLAVVAFNVIVIYGSSLALPIAR
jgi:phospholipid/cholesterol/gamma-HCH transport system permease protein